jgi:hypothetical protein
MEGSKLRAIESSWDQIESFFMFRGGISKRVKVQEPSMKFPIFYFSCEYLELDFFRMYESWLFANHKG